MGKYIVKRLLLIIPTLFLILLTNFIIVQSGARRSCRAALSQIEAEQNRAPPKPNCRRPPIKAVAVYRPTWSRLSKTIRL